MSRRKTLGRRLVGTALAWAVLWLALPALAEPAGSESPDAGAPAAGSPASVVDDLHESLLDVMKRADELGYAGRFDRLEPVLGSLFDTPFMAEKSIGRYWKKLDEAERARLLETFRRFTVANYAGRFDGFSGERFETLGVEPSTHDTVLVHSRLVDSAGEIVQLNYRLHRVDDRWRIFDVYLNGTVSELALRRSEYSSLINREGFDALLVSLDEKIGELESGASSES